MITGFATPVRAQPGGVVVEWSAASACASQAPLAAEVERLLGRPLSEAPAVRVRVAVHRHEPALRLELHMERGEGASSRMLDGPSCDALLRAGALIIAVAIDPDAVAEQQGELEGGEPPAEPPPTAPPAEPSTAVSAEPSVEPPPSAAQPTGRRPSEAQPTGRSQRSAPAVPARAEPAPDGAPLAAPASAPRRLDAADEPTPGSRDELDVRFIAALTPALAIGPLPAPSPALGLALGVGIGPVEMTLAGLATPEQGAELAGSDEAGGRLGLAVGRLRGCASIRPAGEWLELLPCLALEAGALWGHGVNVPIIRSGAAPWVAAAPGLEARVWIADAFALGLTADVLLPFLRPRFVLTLEGEQEELHRAPDVAALLGLTLTLRLR